VIFAVWVVFRTKVGRGHLRLPATELAIEGGLGARDHLDFGFAGGRASLGAVPKQQFTVREDDAGKRLDQLLAARIPELSRRKARVLLDIGGVFVDGARVKVASRKLRAGQSVEAHIGGALDRATKEVGRAARDRDEATLPSHSVVFEDKDLIVVDKPSGLLTAPTPESDRNNLAAMLGDVYVVHRIDLQTSGLLVFAKTGSANRALSERFRVHDVERAYLAAVAGAFPAERERLDRAIGGRRALTHFAIEEDLGGRATLLRCRLETGRTHQIRLHCQHLGHPVLGDPRYGERFDFDPPRMALHAAALGFVHPRTGETLQFRSEWPADLTQWLEAMRK
jgi:23S rRNA pseudouridine1911/1915/1917 synthase